MQRVLEMNNQLFLVNYKVEGFEQEQEKPEGKDGDDGDGQGEMVDRKTLIVKKKKKMIKERNHKTKHLGRMELQRIRIKGHRIKDL
jgi:hypothetical protein